MGRDRRRAVVDLNLEPESVAVRLDDETNCAGDRMSGDGQQRDSPIHHLADTHLNVTAQRNLESERLPFVDRRRRMRLGFHIDDRRRHQVGEVCAHVRKESVGVVAIGG